MGGRVPQRVNSSIIEEEEGICCRFETCQREAKAWKVKRRHRIGQIERRGAV